METKNKHHQLAIADSSGLISLVIVTDSNHQKAQQVFTEAADAELPIVVPAEVFAETINLLGKKFDHARALEAATLLTTSSTFIIAPTTSAMRQDALNTFGRLSSSVSYTDCLVMAVADLHNTTAVFGFDLVFRQRGYDLPAMKRKAA